MAEITDLLFKVLAAFVVSALIGYERASGKKSAGIRTHTIVCITTTMLMIAVSETLATDALSRVIQGIVTGIGFLGAGTILVQQGKHHDATVTGLTTAATIWSVAILGVMVGLGRILEAGIAAVVIFIILEMHRIDDNIRRHEN